MTIGDMPIGAELCLGSLVVPFLNVRIDLQWKKAAAENLFLLTNGSSIKLQMDAKESPESPSRHRRLRGSSFFPQTGLFQWLNGSGAGWFRPCYETDVPPDYADYNGFLTEFSDYERSLLVEQEIQILTPDGFKKEFGNQTTCKCLVSLPSFSQLYQIEEDTQDDEFRCEGQPLCVPMPRYAWTRTGSMGYMYASEGLGDYPNRQAYPHDSGYVFPLISLNPSAEVEGFRDLYVPKCPDGKSDNLVEESELEKILFG